MKRNRFSEEQIIGILKEHKAKLAFQLPIYTGGTASVTPVSTNGKPSLAGWRSRGQAAEDAGGRECTAEAAAGRRQRGARELQDASVKLNEIREKLHSVGEKLQYTTMVRSQLARGAVNKPTIVIMRKGEKGQERIVADEDTELQPGDTVEIALQYQDSPGVPPRKLSSSNTN